LPYGVAKGSKEKNNVFEAMHYIMAAWQQITQQTIQNCFRKAGYKYQSNVKERLHGSLWMINVVESTKVNRVNSTFQQK
jgi:hypothetical protein